MSLIDVDFYLLEKDEPAAIWQASCFLIAQLYLEKQSIFVRCANQDDAIFFDEYLWGFKPESFIPHALASDTPTIPAPIVIGCEPTEKYPILINLAPSLPAIFSELKRIIEIVPAQEAAKAISREHYKYYRAQGFNLLTHKMP